jgi:anthranilate phosphoribosyltransferase
MPWINRTNRLDMPQGRGPARLSLPTYNGARKEANLTPLLALLLQRFGVPVLVHGLLEGYGRVNSAQVFQRTRHHADGLIHCKQRRRSPLTSKRPRFPAAHAPSVPACTACLPLRSRMGVRNSAHSLVKLLNPFRGRRGQGRAGDASGLHLDLMRDILAARGDRGLLLRGTEGEPFANPKRRPRLEYHPRRQWSMCCSGPNTKACGRPA